MNIIKIKLEDVPVKLLLKRFGKIHKAVKYFEEKSGVTIENIGKNIPLVEIDEEKFILAFFTVSAGRDLDDCYEKMSHIIWEMFDAFAEVFFHHYALDDVEVYGQVQYDRYFQTNIEPFTVEQEDTTINYW